jgi:hypothetical protein
MHPRLLFYALVVFLKKWAYIEKDITIRNKGVNKTKQGQPKGVKPKIRDGKLRSGVNWQEVLKQKGVKQTGVKRDLGSRFLQFPQNQ